MTEELYSKELVAGGRVRAYTFRSWNFIALVMPNLVTFIKEKTTGKWNRRQHVDTYLDENQDIKEEAMDSLWGINGKVTAHEWEEVPEAVVEDLLAECKHKLSIESIESVVPTKNVIRENTPEPY